MSDLDDGFLPQGEPVRERLGVLAAILVIVVLVLLVGSGWLYVHRSAAGRIAHGTEVAGVALGGMSHDQAVTALRRGLADRVDKPLTLEVGGRDLSIDPAQAGLGVDDSASVDEASTADTWDPSALWDYYTGGSHLDPVITIDPVKLQQTVTAATKAIGTDARDAGVSFAGDQVHVVPARAGQSVDVEATSKNLVAAYLSDSPTAQVVLTTTAPAVTDQQVRASLDNSVNQAVASAVTLRFGTHSVRLTPEEFQSALRLEPRAGKLHLSVDQTQLMALVRTATSRAVNAPTDATMALVGGQPMVVPSMPGTTWSPPVVARTFLTLLHRPEGNRTAVVPSTVGPALFTNADAAALGITQQVSVVTIPFTRAQQSPGELTREVALVDGTVLKPGAVFSLLAAVKPVPGVDLAQLATGLYNAAFYSGLDDVTHTVPSPHVTRFPLGREATVSAGGPDLMFRDDTKYGVLISAAVAVAKNALTVTFWSGPSWTISSATSCSPASAVVDEVTTSRVFHLPGQTAVDHVEKVLTNYTGLPARFCANAASVG